MINDEAETVLRRKRKRKKNSIDQNENAIISTGNLSTTILPSINDNPIYYQLSSSCKILRNRNSMNLNNRFNMIYYFILTIFMILIAPPPPSPKSIIFTRFDNNNIDNETLQQHQHYQQQHLYNQLNYYEIVYYFFKDHNQLFTATSHLNKVDATFNFITQQQPTNRDNQQMQSLSYDQYNNQDQLSVSTSEHNSVLDLTQQQQYNSPINSPDFSPSEMGSGMNPQSYQNDLYSQRSTYHPSTQPFPTPISSASDSLITAKCVNGDDQNDNGDCKQAPSYFSEDSIITPIVIFESSSSSSLPPSISQQPSLQTYSSSHEDNTIITSTISSYTNLPQSSSSLRPTFNKDPFLIKTSFVATPKPSLDSQYLVTHSKHKNVNNTSTKTGRLCKDEDDDDCDDQSSEDSDDDDDDEDNDDNEDSTNNQNNQHAIDNGSGANEDDEGDYNDDENGDQDYDDQSSGDLELSSVTLPVEQHQPTPKGSDQQTVNTYTASSTKSSVNSKGVDDGIPSLKPTSQPEQKAEIEVIIHSTISPRLTIATTTTPISKFEATYSSSINDLENSISPEISPNKDIWSISESKNTTKEWTDNGRTFSINTEPGSGSEPNYGTIKTVKVNDPQDISKFNIENQDDDKPFVSYPTLPSVSQQNNDGENSLTTGTSRQDTVTSEAPQIFATFKPVPMPPNVINTYLNRYYENQPSTLQQQQQQTGSNPSERLVPATGIDLSQSKLPQSRTQSINSRVVPAPINQLRIDKLKQPNPNSMLYIAFGSVITMLLVVVSLLVYSLYCRPKLGARPTIGAQMINSNYPIQNTFNSFSKLVPQSVANNQPVNNYYPANMIVNTKGPSATKTSLMTNNGRPAAPSNKKQFSGDDSFSTSYESSRSMDNLNGNSHYRRDATNHPQNYNTMRPQREGVYNTAGQQAPPLAPKPQLQVRHQVDSAGRVYNDYSQQGVLINGLMVNKKNDGADGRKSSEWYV